MLAIAREDRGSRKLKIIKNTTGYCMKLCVHGNNMAKLVNPAQTL